MALRLWGFVATFFVLYRGFKNKAWKLGFKEALSSVVFIGGFIWICFFIITAITLLPGFMAYLDTSSINVSTENQWVNDGIPYFYTITILIIASLVGSKISSWKPKYADGEKEILKQERIWVRKHLGPLGRLVRVE